MNGWSVLKGGVVCVCELDLNRVLDCNMTMFIYIVSQSPLSE